ncbi:MAG TPA: hypothetical protein VFQ53_10195 [Kofleriaceae bacterium]|nr:hypothetical protein [Kofleriaceae bacterium]
MLLALAASTGCDESSGTANLDDNATTGSAGKPGSGSSGFSSDLAKSLGSGGVGESAPPPSDGGSAMASAGSGSATAVATGSGSAAKPAVDAVTGSMKPAAGSGSGSGATVAAGSAAKPATGSGSAAKPAVGSGSAVVAAGSGSATKPVVDPNAGKPVDPNAGKPGDGKPVGTSLTKVNTAAPRVPVKPPPELAAIKLSLSPNWDRDVGEAGTISLVVKVPNTEQTRVFAFRYGYEDPKAPADRDAYKKWLEDNKILKPTVDRQRGAAWYLEGTDGSGAAVFRFVVNFGGKKLICGGSLYRDSASNQLGDIRDKTIIQAKEICETLAL